MARVTLTLPNSIYSLISVSQTQQHNWQFRANQRLVIPGSLTASGMSAFFTSIGIRPVSGGSVRINVGIDSMQSGFQSIDLSDAWETEGSLTLTLSNGNVITIDSPRVRDRSEPYIWFDQSPAALQSFLVILSRLQDKTLTLTIDDNQNENPIATIRAMPDTVDANGVVNLTGTARDPDTVPDPLALALTANPNIGTFSAITKSGNDWSATWTAPGPADNLREVILTMTATEPDESLTGTASTRVSVRANQAPVVTASADQVTVDVGDTVNLTGTARDPEGLPVTVRWSSSIGGNIRAPTALNTPWVAPAVTESTVVTFTLTASDGVRTSTATATVIVRAPATRPLTLPAVADQAFETGEIVRLDLPAAMQGLAPYIYSAAGLPRGLSFRNRRIVGRPEIPGTFTVTYSVTDSNQDMATRTFDIVVTGTPLPQPIGLNVRVDWGNLFYSSPHSDVTDRIISDEFRCFRGKNTASAILGRSQAGTLTFDLLNDDGLFNEDNEDSELAGLIFPGVQVQLRDGVNPLWTGVLDSHPTKLGNGGQNITKITAYGVLSLSQETTVSGGSLTAESTAQAFIELCDKGGVPFESPQPEPGDAYVMNRWWEIGRLRQALDVLEDTEGGFIFEDREGELGFHLANYRGERTIAKTFVDGVPGTDELQVEGEPQKLIAVKDVHNVVEGDVRQFETKTEEEVYTSEIPIPISLGGRLDLVSAYDPKSGAVTELDDLTAGTDWTANVASDGTGADRTSQVNIEIELMDFNEIHITCAYANIPGQSQVETLYIRDLTIKGTVLKVSTPLLVTQEDTSSKERYNPKVRSVKNTWIRSVADMEMRAADILSVLASPERRISISYLVDDWADFLALDLSDRVRLNLSDALLSDAFIEGIHLRIRRGEVALSTLNLSLVPLAAPVVNTAPSFANPTGDAAAWTQNEVITPITVPQAAGVPAPTYEVIGGLPAGIAFDSAARTITGRPRAAGSGSIRIRATNSEGTADWTIAYTTTAATESVTLTLTAAALGSFAGVFSQHSGSPTGTLSPRTFDIGGKSYSVRGWFYRGSGDPRLEINMDSAQMETDFKAAGLTVDLGQGESFNSADMVNASNVLRIAMSTAYVAGQTYTITITDS